MPRPRKCRRVGFVPDNQCFSPQVANCEEVVLSVEEVEAIRLSDYVGMEQDDAADSMKVSRGTYQRIINSARGKTADALVHGKAIRIGGGDYELTAGIACCGKHAGSCRGNRCRNCKDCENYKQNTHSEVKNCE